MAVFATLFFVYVWLFESTISSEQPSPIIDNIAQIGRLVNVADAFSVIETEIKFVHPDAIAFNKDTYPENEYLFDEAMDCVFDLFDLTDQIQGIMPIIANKLELKLKNDQAIEKNLYKAVQSSIYILCQATNAEKILDDGFVEWITMTDKKRRRNIESIIVTKMKKAFKLKLTRKEKKKVKQEKYGQELYKKCLKQLKPKLIPRLYQKLRRKYGRQRNMLDMIKGIFMYSCSRKYGTPESVKELMQKVVSMDDVHVFFRYFADIMEPILDSSKDTNQCIAQTAEITYLLERFLLKHHSEFKKYPVFNAMDGLIAMGCAKNFEFEDDGLPNMEDIPWPTEQANNGAYGHPEL